MTQMLCVVTLYNPCEKQQAIVIFLKSFLYINFFYNMQKCEMDVTNSIRDSLYKKQVTFF